MASVLPLLLLVLWRGAEASGAQPLRVLVSDGCAQNGPREEQLELDPDSPLVLTHRIRLLPGSASTCGACEGLAAVRDRIERLERELSELRERCGGAHGCCGSQQSKGVICSTAGPATRDCPEDCSDQGRCVDGACVCFSGFSGPDCSVADCPGDCSGRGRCVDGRCVCDPGFSGPDCSSSSCPENCKNRGRCVNGRCVCEAGFTGSDCGSQSCPENCQHRGRCVNSRCVCDAGFSGPDCSETSCPGNCHNRGRCVDGQCRCDPGFSGPDCSVKACPGNCHSRGRCVDGACVCDAGFTGADCSAKSCPGDCSAHGECVGGRCVCDSGFTGPDCSSRTCPNNCNNKGRCVDGRCVCDVGFSGQDCSVKSCPSNCSERGRCVRGRCVCRRGFTGPDCGHCQPGFTGENCDTALAGVSNLRTRDVTESSVTLSWTPPAVQYDTYHITFTSTKEREQKISSRVSGGRSWFTQTGLASGQEYTAHITGEKEGLMGAESTAQFSTLISGPKNLQVMKTSTTSVIVQWEKAQGEIDRYVLSVAPNQTDGSSRLPERSLPPERDSAQIDGLEPGRLYDIALVAEKESARSLPANTQAIPEKASAPVTRMPVGTEVQQKDVEAGDGKENLTRPDTNTTVLLRNHRLSKGGQTTAGNISRLRPGALVRPGQRRPTPLRKNGMFLKPPMQPGVIRRPSSEMKPLNSSQIGVKRGLVIPSSNTSRTWYPLRPRNPNVDAAHPVSDGKPVALTMKESESRAGNAEIDFSRESVETPRNSIASSGFQKHTGTSSVSPPLSTRTAESTEEPTLTTEKNLTAYVNGTKCVRKVLVGYRKIHGNMSDGSVLSKNMTVVVGHVNGNEVLHKLLTSNGTEDTGLDEAPAKAGISEAGGSVEEENADVRNAVPFSTSRPETTLDLSSATPLPTPHPERDGRQTARHQSAAGPPPGKNTSLSIPRQSPRPKPPGLPFRLKTNPSASFPETRKEKRTFLSRPYAFRFAKETLVENEVVNSVIPTTREIQHSAPRRAYESNAGTTPLPGQFPLKNGSEIKNRGTEVSDPMAHLRLPPRRPNVSPFQNRTRPFLDPARQALRGRVRRPFPSKPMTKNNATLSRVSSVQPMTPALTAAGENGTGIKIRPNVPLNATSRHSQINPNGGTAAAPNIAPYGKGNSDHSFSTERLMENDNKSQENILSETEDSIEHLEVNNRTSTGLVLIWAAPKGKFKHFVITRSELVPEQTGKNELDEENEGKVEGGAEEKHEGNGEEEGNDGKELKASAARKRGFSEVHEPVSDLLMNGTEVALVLPGSVRSHRMENLTPQTRYSVSIFGKGQTFRSKTHNLIIHTGPEPPSDLVFSDVTDGLFTVSWSKPKSKVSGFKITYTQVQEGEPVSMSVGSETLRVPLTPVSPGSTYEVSVMALLGPDESDSIKGRVTTLPDPPTDLRAVNVSDSGALLLWRPALAPVDRYIIAYRPHTAPGSVITVEVSGNAAEQHLHELQASSMYSVSVRSRLGEWTSSGATATFTTASRAAKTEDGPRDLRASQVTPRTALLSWKPPASAVTGYKLSYYTDGQDVKEVTLGPAVTELKLTRLSSSSRYTARLQAVSGGVDLSAASTQFTTGSLRFPFPTDCAQEQQNGAPESGVVEVFPQGRTGAPALVYCDMESDGGGWTVFQRRKDGKTNFFKKWRDYSSGFGALDGEFWLGNELLHNFTKMTPMTLRVDLRAGDESVYAHYSSFSVENAKKHYALRISGYSGTAGDSMSYHSGRPFSTRDRDPRPFITRCAMSYRGGWWYKNCHEANLNGLYNTSTNHQGVIWTAWKGKDFSIPFTEMKFRPASFRP